MKNYYVYIMTNKYKTTFYIGVTSDLLKRVSLHKNKEIEGFTQKYGLNELMYFEETNSIEVAIKREKQLKNWHRQWKINLIKDINPTMDDLSELWGL